jgi:hypothetical protein
VKEDRKKGFIDAGLVKATEMTPCGDWQLDASAAVDPFLSDVMPGGEKGSAIATLTFATYRAWDITGIVQDGPKAKVDVRFTFDTNQAGKMMAKAIPCPEDDHCRFSADGREAYVNDRVSFTRYDDGWRVDEPTQDK